MLHGMILGASEVGLIVLAFFAVVLLIALAVCSAKLWAGRTTALVQKLMKDRAEFGKLATILVSRGFKKSADIFMALSQGNVVEAFGKAKALRQQLSDEKQAATLLRDQFLAELPFQLGDIAGRALVLKAMGEWAVANPDLVKAAGLSIAVLSK